MNFHVSQHIAFAGELFATFWTQVRGEAGVAIFVLVEHGLFLEGLLTHRALKHDRLPFVDRVDVVHVGFFSYDELVTPYPLAYLLLVVLLLLDFFPSLDFFF